MIKKLFITLLLLLLPSLGWATDYYVDTASDGGDGTTTATTGAQAAFKTIAAAQAAVTGDQHGNSLLFKKDGVWREQFTVGANGTAAGQFTVGAYGTGADPIISGADLIAGSFSKVTEVAGSEAQEEDFVNPDYVYAYPVTVTSGGVLVSFDIWLGVDVNGKATDLKCAMFTNSGGAPSTLIANTTSETITSFTNSSYHTLAVTSGATITPGDYWIGFLIDGVAFKGPRDGAGGGAMDYDSQAFGDGFPATWDSAGTSATWSTSFHINLEYPTIWRKDIGSTEPYIVIFNTSTVGVEDATPDAAYEWSYTDPNLDVYATEDPDTYYGTIEAGQRDYGIDSGTKDYITVTGLQIEGVNFRGINTESSEYWIIDSNTITRGGGKIYSEGIVCNGVAFSAGHGHNTISNNLITYFNGDGIYLLEEDYDIVSGNTINNIIGANSDNMQLENCSNFTITRNTLSLEGTDSTKGNIISTGGTDGLVTYNDCRYGNFGVSINSDDSVIMYNYSAEHVLEAWSGGYYQGGFVTDNILTAYNISNHDNHGIVAHSGQEHTNMKYYGNTIYNSANYAIRLEEIDGIVKNNIVSTYTTRALSVASLAAAGSLVLDNNCFYPEAASYIYYIDTAYSTLAAYVAAKSQDTNSIKDDPLFTTPGSVFTLQAGSPCINAGENLGATYDDALDPISSWPDAVVTKLQNDYGWEIGAYAYGETTTLGLGNIYKYNLIQYAGILYLPEGATGCVINDDSIRGTLYLAESVDVYNTWIVTIDLVGLAADEPVVFYNCAFVESQATIEAKNALDDLTFTDCLFEIATSNFRDYAGEDYHLTAGSTLTDAGYNTGADIDVEGKTVPIGSGYDIGAYEYYPRGTRPMGMGMSLKGGYCPYRWPDD